MGIGLGIGRGHAPKSEPTLWLLQDEFATDLAAGSVNGTAAEPGPGTRAVVDVEGIMTVSTGMVCFNNQATPAWGDAYCRYASIARTPGRMLLGTMWSTNGGNALFGLSTSTTPSGAGLGNFEAGEVFWANAFFSYGTDWHKCYALRAAGYFAFVKSATFPAWTLQWVSATGTTANLYPAVSQYNTTSTGNFVKVGGVRVPDALWLPTPLVSDGFGSAFGVSDGLGHAEGIAGGIGAGGAGVTFSNVGGTWSVSGGKAINTPTPGANLIVNGGMELDSNWSSQSTPVVNERSTAQVHGEIYSRKLVADSNGDAVGQDVTGITIGKWYRVQAWVYLESGSSIAIQDYSGGVWVVYLSVAGSWQLLHVTFRAIYSNSLFALRSFISTPVTAYIDDASFTLLTIAELLSLCDLSCSSVFASVSITRSNSSVESGLALSWDSVATPSNGVIVELWGGSIYVLKCVAGVWSTVSSTAYTYSAGAALVVSKSGTEYRVYYNNALLTVQTISDAGIVSNTLHGLFSTDASNTLDDFVCYATGTGGEYAELDKWS